MKSLLQALLRFTVCAAVLALLWLSGFIYFLSLVPQEPTKNTQRTDAIVVLTGGKGRIDYGRELLRQGKAARLFISGVEENVTPQQLGLSGGPSVILLGHGARNTIGNAQETAEWVRREHLTSLRLVTANYHMPRALNEFQQAMPNVTIIPDPLLSERFTLTGLWQMDDGSRLFLKEYHKSIAAKLRHWLIEALEEKP